MKERPILFAGPMVRAILDGRKTQTRRSLKLPADQSIYFDGKVHPAVQAITHRGAGWFGFDAPDETKKAYSTTFPFFTIRCPYGVIGDRLWVREKWTIADMLDGPADDQQGALIAYAADGSTSERCIPQPDPVARDTEFQKWQQKLEYFEVCGAEDNWMPSIHMPRWASRITLEITSVRVERVQDIGEEDAIAEGCEKHLCTAEDTASCKPGSIERALAEKLEGGYLTAKFDFEQLWSSINGPGSWEKNPWVWVMGFSVVPAEDPVFGPAVKTADEVRDPRNPGGEG